MSSFFLTITGILLSCTLLSAVHAAEVCRYSWLFTPDHWQLSTGQKELLGDQLQHPNSDLFTLSGNASVTLSDKKLNADLIRYHQETDKAYAFGHVRIQNKQYIAMADTAEHDEKMQITQLEQLNYQFLKSQAWGTADKAVITQANEQVAFHKLRYTGCPIGEESWWMSFDKLVVDDKTKYATGDHAVLRFHDVPVFYFPKFRFSTADRASGFLMPTFTSYYTEGSGSSSTKSIIKIPYYFDIAPNMDDTLTLVQISDRGQAIDNEFRYWFNNQRGDLTTTFLHDNTTRQDRYRIWWNASQTLPNNWQLGWSWHDTSDPAFYRETQLTEFYLRNVLYLSRSMSLSKSWQNQQLNISLLDFKQMLYGQPYYSALPSVQHQWRFEPSHLPYYARMNTEFSHFLAPQERTPLVVGNLLHLAPTLGFDVWKPYGFLRGKTQLLMTQYALNENSDNSLSRVLPLASLDAGITFEKSVSLLNQNLIHTLEPRIKYLYVGTQDQSQFPVFDTMLRNFDYLQLYADNRFTGLDRVGDTNQITTGLFSRLFRNSGQEFLELGAGQITYFQNRKVQLGNQPTETNEFSDIIVTASLVQNRWRANLTQQLDRDSKQLIQEDTSLQYIADGDNRLILRNRLRKQATLKEDEQTTIGGKIRYNGLFSSMHFMNYNHSSKQLRNAVNAVQYDSCCWAAQLIWERNHYDQQSYLNQGQDDIIRLAFIFKGLTTFGSTAGDKVDSRLYFE
jgi:LPS-assembly protein